MTEAEKVMIDTLKRKREINDTFVEQYWKTESPLSFERALYELCINDNKGIDTLLKNLELQGRKYDVG